jgi:hypothetical protein
MERVSMRQERKLKHSIKCGATGFYGSNKHSYLNSLTVSFLLLMKGGEILTQLEKACMGLSRKLE